MKQKIANEIHLFVRISFIRADEYEATNFRQIGNF